MKRMTSRDKRSAWGGGISAVMLLVFGMLLLFTNTAAAAAGAGDSLERALQIITASNIGPTPDAPPAPTGDALYDRFALAVDARILALPASATPEQAAAVALLPDADLAGWAGEFGQDPRYWELRYFCAKCDMETRPLAGGCTAAIDFLLEARRRNIATANTLGLLSIETRVQNARELDAANGGTAELMQVQDDALLALLDAAVTADPGQAWGYYARAMFRFGLGDPDLGLDDLRAGNKAERNRYPYPWPMSELAAVARAKQLPGSPAVWGAVRVAGLGYPLQNFMRIKDCLKEALVCANIGGRMEDLEPWHQFACRLGDSAPDVLIYAVVGSSLESMLISYAEDAAAYDAAQVETLQRCRGAVGAMRNVMRGRGMRDAVLPQLLQLTTALGSKRGYFVTHYVDACDEARYCAILAPMFGELSQVHFPEFAMPPVLLKYEPKPAPVS
jgi:hypothetical protein